MSLQSFYHFGWNGEFPRTSDCMHAPGLEKRAQSKALVPSNVVYQSWSTVAVPCNDSVMMEDFSEDIHQIVDRYLIRADQVEDIQSNIGRNASPLVNLDPLLAGIGLSHGGSFKSCQFSGLGRKSSDYAHRLSSLRLEVAASIHSSTASLYLAVL